MPAGQADPPSRRLERQAELAAVLSFASFHRGSDLPGAHEILKAGHIEFQERCDLGRLNDGTILVECDLRGKAEAHDTALFR